MTWMFFDLNVTVSIYHNSLFVAPIPNHIEEKKKVTNTKLSQYLNPRTPVNGLVFTQHFSTQFEHFLTLSTIYKFTQALCLSNY